MNTETESAAKAAKAKSTPEPAPSVTVRFEVLAPKLEIAGGTAGKGRKLNVTQAVARFHEDRGEVKVLGTVA
jgi:hypothetical protein